MDEELMQAFCKVPAGIRHHHAYLGGLVEHVTGLMEAWDRLAPLYPSVNKDLLFMGIFLHDIGKIRELTCDKALAYSDEGQLIGHTGASSASDFAHLHFEVLLNGRQVNPRQYLAKARG